MGFNAFSLFGAYNSSITARWAVVSEILRLLEVRELAVLDWFFQESQLSWNEFEVNIEFRKKTNWTVSQGTSDYVYCYNLQLDLSIITQEEVKFTSG